VKTFRTRCVRRVLVPVMAVSLLSACTYWKVEEMAPSQVVSEKEPSRVFLTMLDGSEVELENPWVSDGEILAHPRDPYNQVYGVVSPDTLRVPADSVARIEILKPDSGVTALLVTLGLVAVGLAIVAIICTDGCW